MRVYLTKETDVLCPGCNTWNDPNLMNAGSIGIEIQNKGEVVSHSTFYCPACVDKMLAMDGEELLNKVEKAVAEILKACHTS